MTRRAIAFVAASLFAAIAPAKVQAANVETFSFTQQFGSGATITGSFTGTPETDGSIQLADLTGFTATYALNAGPPTGNFVDTYALANLLLFSIFPAADGPNSSLDIFADITTAPSGSICVGAVAAFGECGDSGNFSGEVHVRYSQNPFLFDHTTATANVTFVSAPIATSEPGLLGVTALVLPLLLRRRDHGPKNAVGTRGGALS